MVGSHERSESGYQEWPEGDPKFAGVREEVRRLVDGVTVQLRDGLTARQKKAAELFAKTLDCDAVDAMLDLPIGTVRTWALDESFMRSAVEARLLCELYEPPRVDAGQALQPAQREAARLLAAEHMNQTETAAMVGVDRRTIYNWRRLPTFLAHMRQVETEEKERRARRLAARRGPMLEELDELRAVVVRNAKRSVEDGDPKLTAQILGSVLTKY